MYHWEQEVFAAGIGQKKKKREKKSTVALRNDKISQGDIFVWRKIVSACLTTNHFRGILGKRI